MGVRKINNRWMAHYTHCGKTKNPSTKHHAIAIAGGVKYMVPHTHPFAYAIQNDRLPSGNSNSRSINATTFAPASSGDNAMKSFWPASKQQRRPWIPA